MRRLTASLLLLALPACMTFAEPTAKTMSFATMQTLQPGVDGEWILSEYPFARDVERQPNGRIRSMGYWVDDPAGKSRPLMLHFDTEGRLARKQYGGPIIRPPEPGESKSPFSIGG